MKDKLFIAILVLLLGHSAFAQEKTLNVFLEKNPEHRTGVDLVFENNSNDTIFLFTRFINHTFEREASISSGILIEFFRNDNPFRFSWGMPIQPFIFSHGRTLIYPQSKVKLFFDVGYFYHFPLPEEATGKLEVSFFMSYMYSIVGSTGQPNRVHHFQTNRVTIVEPMKDVEKEVDCEIDIKISVKQI